MSIQVDGKAVRIGLALSGGGFRAAAFHLGVMRQLKDMRLLDKIDLFTCVSGGSIAGAVVALNWQNPNKLDILENYLRTRSVAVSSVIRGLVDPFDTRLEKLADSYDDDLFKQATLGALAKGPRIYINATDLATGNLFFFAAGGGKSCDMGDYELGFVDGTAFPLARAVAASSAFPPVFPPLRLDKSEYQLSGEVEYLTLTDGGVYDNLGVNPLLRERNDLQYAFISDGGKPFAVDTHPTEDGALVLKAGLDIMMEQVRGLQFDRLYHHHLAGTGPLPMWFSIDSKSGAADPADPVFASSIRTNLAKLSDAEMTVLMRQGASLVRARIEQFAPELLTPQ
jgi:NTE family protein